MNKACFLDRDGTVIVDKSYISSPAEIEFIPGVPETLAEIQALGYLLIVITNQSGVARGYYSIDDVENVCNEMCRRLYEEYGVEIDAVYYCPHHPEGINEFAGVCSCRKPAPGMILQAAQDFDIDIAQSVMVGDKDTDHIQLEDLRFVKISVNETWKTTDIFN